MTRMYVRVGSRVTVALIAVVHSLSIPDIAQGEDIWKKEAKAMEAYFHFIGVSPEQIFAPLLWISAAFFALRQCALSCTRISLDYQ